jgi:hypothetical protein
MDESKPAAATATAPPSPLSEPPVARPNAPGRIQQPAPAPPAPPTDALVEQWWRDHFPGSAVAQATAAWNVAFAAKEDLKQRLKKGI